MNNNSLRTYHKKWRKKNPEKSKLIKQRYEIKKKEKRKKIKEQKQKQKEEMMF